MSLTGITFANQKITPSDDGRLYGAMLADGILTGCGITFAAATLSVAEGSLLIGTRELRTSGETLSVTGATSGYARVIIDIDLTRAATKTSFEQAQFKIQYAASVSAFPALIQQNINGSGTHYQTMFCVMSLGTAGITGIVSRLHSAVVPVSSGGTGATTAAAARTNLGALSSAAGAVGTMNLGSKVVTAAKIADETLTRKKMASDVLGIASDSRSDTTPFDAECNGKLYVVSPSANRSFTLTAEDIAALPTGWAVTLVRGSVYGGYTYTLKWEADIPVLNGNDRKMSWSGAGSVSLNRVGDMVTITKWTSEPRIIVMGNTSVRNIYAGTSATPPSTWTNGDIYLQYK